jgi:hypothetical protein
VRLPHLALVVAVVLAGPASAQEVTRSPVPPANPVLASEPAQVAEPPAGEGLARSLRPKPRPGAIADLTVAVAEAKKPKPFLGGLFRPRARPSDTMSASADAPAPRKQTTRKGSVCGVAEIKGEVLAPIKSKVDGCGVAEPVRVTSVSGVTLSQSANIDCDTARALNTWVAEVVQPAFGRNGVVELQVAAHYVCRGRNNKRGARISEHGRGRAIDISGFRLEDGTLLTVADDYNRTLRRVHDKACGIFGTTLGPGSDGYHEDHIHLDTARHRNGPYCR